MSSSGCRVVERGQARKGDPRRRIGIEREEWVWLRRGMRREMDDDGGTGCQLFFSFFLSFFFSLSYSFFFPTGSTDLASFLLTSFSFYLPCEADVLFITLAATNLNFCAQGRGDVLQGISCILHLL